MHIRLAMLLRASIVCLGSAVGCIRSSIVRLRAAIKDIRPAVVGLRFAIRRLRPPIKISQRGSRVPALRQFSRIVRARTAVAEHAPIILAEFRPGGVVVPTVELIELLAGVGPAGNYRRLT